MENEQTTKPVKPPMPDKIEKKGGVKDFFRRWWHNKTARRTTIAVVLLLIAAVATYPRTRYFLLNSAGVRSSASVVIIDNASRLPLKNVTVSLNNSSGATNEDGYVELQEVRLGDTTLKVERRAFATFEKSVTVGWGSNPLGEVILEPQGLQYNFMVKDFLSDQPIVKAEATSGDASAFSDKDGKIILTLDTAPDEPVKIDIAAEGYRQEMLTETADGTIDTEVKMVPARQQAFISKRSGKYDLYKIYADGKGEELVLQGTGYERDDIALAAEPNGNNVALISTRDNMRGADGNLLNSLNIVNLDDDSVTELDSGSQIQPVGWIDKTLVYIVVTDKVVDGQAKRQRLVSYNLETTQKLDITSATYFNAAMVGGDKIYYAPANEDKDNPVGLYMSDETGVNIEKLLDAEVWSLIRSDYSTVSISSGNDWYEMKIGENKPTRRNGAPVNQKTRNYVNNASNSLSLWVDERDGKGVLLSYNVENGEDKILVGQSGLNYPVRWLNETTAVYRVNNDNETADYVVSTQGGDPRKIVDVTNTAGLERWYYF